MGYLVGRDKKNMFKIHVLSMTRGYGFALIALAPSPGYCV